MECYTILLFCLTLLNNIAARDTITSLQSINDSETIVSASEIFALGFFSPHNSENRYLGIWYQKFPAETAVWVANRDNPLTDSSGVLKFSENGILVLLNHNNSVIWSSNTTRLVQNPIAKLLDSGNFIVQDSSKSDPNEEFLWQSFDYPSDSILPGQKFGRNLITGLNRYLTSWNSSDDPSHGKYTYQVDVVGFPQIVLREGNAKRFRLGSWNGIYFSGGPQMKQNTIFTFKFVSNEKEAYFLFEPVNSSFLHRLVLTSDGLIEGRHWRGVNKDWTLTAKIPLDDCDQYAKCGAYASCNIEDIPVCSCLEGFVTEKKDIYGDCIRRTSLTCNKDGFLKFSRKKLPDTGKSWFNRDISVEDCRILCKNNCSCTAYAASDISKGASGCLHWYDKLVDMKEFAESDDDIYIRMAGTELRKMEENTEKDTNAINEHHREDPDLPLFDMPTITSATNNFSTGNILGEGGFGLVFKGILEDGREIAVKRLSLNSSQGIPEFKNEVMHIAKLQHRNIVRLLGCCFHGGERLLIYEFMPNKSLDYFIFDGKKDKLLDWSMRLDIINGIARGILYLHQDSRHRIVHRDLKAANILLDNEMNPKISDFGLARSFGGNGTEANTQHVVGTYGYLSPEYIIDGEYSTKSDVFSFGVLVLEIISGKRNRGFYHQEHRFNLLGHAWRLFTEGKCHELVDETIRDSFNICSVTRSIHVGLLCVQVSQDERPNMSSVVLMLSSEFPLPQPKEPGFYTERDPLHHTSSSSSSKPFSTNDITITTLDAR
ncbi:hypothetical protein TanjilG_09975 [Lupinus angustifolius]|uniref:Receptor-like serine/threonine-protein kinase n=1 Tax=Lupinus angustifolius TaxID=3871 RepID=A0A1J7GDB9_LUPAN|nr:hypothetical protein TanjilG_09975 [Lupinus angustifolius]